MASMDGIGSRFLLRSSTTEEKNSQHHSRCTIFNEHVRDLQVIPSAAISCILQQADTILMES